MNGLTSIIQDGVDLNPADFGSQMSLTLSEAGIAVMITRGEEDMSGTRTTVDTGAEITIDGDAVGFVLENGKLVGESDGMSMVFEKLGLPGIWYQESMVEDGNEYLSAGGQGNGADSEQIRHSWNDCHR